MKPDRAPVEMRIIRSVNVWNDVEQSKYCAKQFTYLKIQPTEHRATSINTM